MKKYNIVLVHGVRAVEIYIYTDGPTVKFNLIIYIYQYLYMYIYCAIHKHFIV